MQWIKVWGEKLLSSTNFGENLKLAEKGTYLCCLLMARTDGPNAGYMCHPTGKPMRLTEVAKKLHSTIGVIKQHVDKLIDLGMIQYKGIYIDKTAKSDEDRIIKVYYIRKYRTLNEKNYETPETDSENLPNVLKKDFKNIQNVLAKDSENVQDTESDPKVIDEIDLSKILPPEIAESTGVREENRREVEENTNIILAPEGSVEPSEASKASSNSKKEIVCPKELAEIKCYHDLERAAELERKGIQSLWERWEKLYEDWKAAYPGIDVLAQIRLAYGWEARQNLPDKKRNKVTFIGRWLNRAQANKEKGGFHGGTGGKNLGTNRSFDSARANEGQYDHLS